MGTKESRESGGAALYTWLYRHCNKWLLKINARYKRPISVINNRVNWKARDRETVKTLISIRNKSESDLSCPMQSRNWFLSKLHRGTTICKQLNKLPLTSAFLARYSESTTEYQMRRLALAVSKTREKSISRWQLLRIAGLSDERASILTQEAMRHLERAGIIKRSKHKAR